MMSSRDRKGILTKQGLDRVAVRQHTHNLVDGHASPFHACLPMADVRIYRDPVELHVRILHSKFNSKAISSRSI
jgi:hypothetical protein